MSEYKSGPFIAVGGADPLGIFTDEEVDAWGEESAVIRVKDGSLYLTGGYKRGCMYAVYSFRAVKCGFGMLRKSREWTRNIPLRESSTRIITAI